MNMSCDFAPRMVGTVPYQLRHKEVFWIRALLMLASIVVRTMGMLWRAIAAVVTYFIPTSSSDSNASSASSASIKRREFGLPLKKILAPALFVVCGYFSHQMYGLVGIYGFLLASLSLYLLVRAFASGFADGMQEKEH